MQFPHFGNFFRESSATNCDWCCYLHISCLRDTFSKKWRSIVFFSHSSSKVRCMLRLSPRESAPPTWFPGCCWRCAVGSWWSQRSWTQSSWLRRGRKRWMRRRRTTRWGTWRCRCDPSTCWLEWCRYCRSGCRNLGGEVEAVLWSRNLLIMILNILWQNHFQKT